MPTQEEFEQSLEELGLDEVNNRLSVGRRDCVYQRRKYDWAMYWVRKKHAELQADADADAAQYNQAERGLEKKEESNKINYFITIILALTLLVGVISLILVSFP